MDKRATIKPRRKYRNQARKRRAWFITRWWWGDSKIEEYAYTQLWLTKLPRRLGWQILRTFIEGGDKGGNSHYSLFVNNFSR